MHHYNVTTKTLWQCRETKTLYTLHYRSFELLKYMRAWVANFSNLHGVAVLTLMLSPLIGVDFSPFQSITRK